MKKLLVSFALASSLFLASCDTTIDAATVAAEITAAQQTAVQICGFLPTVSTITKIISTFVPGASPVNDVATQVASAICSAVSAKSLKRGAVARPTVRGVPVEGKFVR